MYKWGERRDEPAVSACRRADPRAQASSSGGGEQGPAALLGGLVALRRLVRC